jgi:hypothetical protein
VETISPVQIVLGFLGELQPTIGIQIAHISTTEPRIFPLIRFGTCGGDGSMGCDGIPYSTTEYDECGICGGDGSTCTCTTYLGFDMKSVDYALLRYTVLSAR